MSKQAAADGFSGRRAGETVTEEPIDFRTHPDRYRHWRLRFEPPLAFLTREVDEHAGLRPGYQLKQNSYDLGVDFELYDATQRLTAPSTTTS